MRLGWPPLHVEWREDWEPCRLPRVDGQVGEMKDRDDGAYFLGLTTVTSPLKIALHARRNGAENLERVCTRMRDEGGG